MNEQVLAPPYPDGIDAGNIRPISAWQRGVSTLGIAVFGAVVLVALTGWLGHERTWVAEASGTRLQVHGPEVIRSGELFEMRMRVSAEEPIEELAIGVDADIWTDMTVNTMIPAATEERSADGELRFTFGELDADTEFLLKADLQVNPDIVLGGGGTVTVYDGGTELVATDISIMVLP